MHDESKGERERRRYGYGVWTWRLRRGKLQCNVSRYIRVHQCIEIHQEDTPPQCGGSRQVL